MRNHQAKCENCRHFMVPRVVFRDHEPSHSICPFCGVTFRIFQCNGDAFAFGEFIGRIWKMAAIRDGFVESMTQAGVSPLIAKRVFSLLKLLAVLGVVYLLN